MNNTLNLSSTVPHHLCFFPLLFSFCSSEKKQHSQFTAQILGSSILAPPHACLVSCQHLQISEHQQNLRKIQILRSYSTSSALFRRLGRQQVEQQKLHLKASFIYLFHLVKSLYLSVAISASPADCYSLVLTSASKMHLSCLSPTGPPHSPSLSCCPCIRKYRTSQKDLEVGGEEGRGEW